MAILRIVDGKFVDPSGNVFDSMQEYGDHLGVTVKGFESAKNLFEGYKILKYKNAFAYTKKSSFPFGKYKGHTLQDIWVIEISYIEWCLSALNHFAIDPDEFMSLQSNGIYYYSDLEKYIKSNTNNITIDLSLASRASNGYIIIKNTQFADYKLPKATEERNFENLNSVMSEGRVIQGGNFNKESERSYNGQKTTISLNLPK